MNLVHNVLGSWLRTLEMNEAKTTTRDNINIKDPSIHKKFLELQNYLNTRIIGQQKLISRLLIALLSDGHLLVEGAPGLAKTRAIKELANALEGKFHRIQFTPDLLPGDLTGTDVFRHEDSTFVFQKGPLFHNLVLADEINRAPAKVQSALLEAMAERQITIGSNTYLLPELFLVMATQNPIEQEGTYPLPEAQLDRFLMYIKIGYPEKDVEKEILKLARAEAVSNQPSEKITEEFTPLEQALIFKARNEVLKTHTSEALETYLINLVLATRNPHLYSEKIKNWLRFGASPRATIALDRCAKAHAWLDGRDFVTPNDIQAVANDVLCHRVLLTFEAEALGVTNEDFMNELLRLVPVP